jgi:hypothetical protein
MSTLKSLFNRPKMQTNGFAEAIKRANWAMKEDAACAQAHRHWLAAKLELALAFRDALPAARAEYEEAKRDWYRLTEAVFDRVMAEE